MTQAKTALVQARSLKSKLAPLSALPMRRQHPRFQLIWLLATLAWSLSPRRVQAQTMPA